MTIASNGAYLIISLELLPWRQWKKKG